MGVRVDTNQMPSYPELKQADQEKVISLRDTEVNQMEQLRDTMANFEEEEIKFDKDELQRQIEEEGKPKLLGALLMEDHFAPKKQVSLEDKRRRL